MSSFPNITKQKGFSLVEMVIYVAIFAILSLVAMQATLTIMRSFYVIRLTQAINQSATVALERMSREIRNAYDIDTVASTFNTSPGRLTLRTEDAFGANTTIEFFVSDGQLRMKEGSIDKGVLLAKNVTVTNLVFHDVATLHSRAIKIEMTLRNTRAGDTRDLVLYDTIVLRGVIR